MVFSGECYVSLYNLELDKAQWCRIGEDVFGGKVTGYDTEMGVVSYAHGGRTYQYALADDLDERAQLIAESRQPRFGSDGRAVEKRAYSSMPIGQQIHYNDPRFKERLLQQNIELPANWGTPGFQQDLIDQRDQLREESKSQALAAKDRRASNGSGSKRIFPISPVNSGLSVPQKEVRAAINGGAK